ncbi:F-box/WD repeat-containing protein 9-like [Ornithodoros turicata]|uniref:F-box/WD repeat-containing protein 9-like n=1 Tax=Ornithodoros turicata TaxID=34597 RepID=UPI00313883AA
MRLEALPNEILFRVFSFLDAAFIVDVLSKVCTTFEAVINDHTFWKGKLFQQWPKTYPVVPVNDSFDWKRACFDREEHYKVWTSWGRNVTPIYFESPHIGFVNVVQLLNNGSLCASGSRDKDIKLWNIKADRNGDVLDSSQRLVHALPDAHGGWVWCMCAHDNTLYSGGWDSAVKMWDLDHGLAQINSLRVKTAVLCLCNVGNLLSFGTYGGSIYCHDKREPAGNLRRLLGAKSSITCMAMDDRALIAGCQGGHLAVVDLRTWKMRENFSEFDGYPSAVSYDMEQLWVGTRCGSVYIVDATGDKLKSVQSFSLAKQASVVSGIHHSLGSVLVSILESPMYVLEPTLDAEVISLGAPKDNVDRFQVHGTTLVTAGRSTIKVWHPQ